MCEYCRKLTQRAHRLKEGFDVNIGFEGDVFVDYFNNLITHLESKADDRAIEVSVPVRYCPWCGSKLEATKV